MPSVFLVISTPFVLVKRGEVAQRSVGMMIFFLLTSSLKVTFL